MKMFEKFPQPELRGIIRRIRWMLGLKVYDWDRERWR